MASALPTSPLVEFSYASRASDDLPDAALLRLAQHAWSRNTRLGVTGALTFEDGVFHQVIEGPSDIMLPLVSRILTDPRHEAIHILGFRQIMTRRFDAWSASGFGMRGEIPIAGDTREDGPVEPLRRERPAKVANICG